MTVSSGITIDGIRDSSISVKLLSESINKTAATLTANIHLLCVDATEHRWMSDNQYVVAFTFQLE